MASVAPWILLSFALVICAAQDGVVVDEVDKLFPKLNPCSCTSLHNLSGPIPLQRITQCHNQSLTDCIPAMVFKTKKYRKLCLNATLSWINDYINNGQLSCSPLFV